MCIQRGDAVNVVGSGKYLVSGGLTSASRKADAGR
jgi:hypothetical protein